MSKREWDDAQNIIIYILIYVIYVIHKKFELNICWFYTHVILLPGWSWDTPNSMKPLILTFLWVKFDSCCGASPPQPPSSLYMDGYSTAAVYGYFLPVTIGRFIPFSRSSLKSPGSLTWVFSRFCGGECGYTLMMTKSFHAYRKDFADTTVSSISTQQI